jgi:predicted outer membrane repeat protein
MIKRFPIFSRPATPGARRFRSARGAALLLAGLAAGAQAATNNVNTFDMNLVNDAFCGLREAILAINAGGQMWGCPGGDNASNNIYLPAGTYTAPVGMEITRHVNIICLGPGACNIDAGNFTGAMITVTGGPGDFATFQRVTFRQPSGNANNVTGLLAEAGRVTLEDCVVSGFKLNGLVLSGGANHNVLRTTFSGNATQGIFVAPDVNLFISYSTLTGNTQSGIVMGPNATVTSQANLISDHGQDGVGLSQGADFIDDGSTIYNNGGAGIYGSGDVDLTRTVVRKNRNKGIHLDGGYGELEYCSIDSNSTSGTGGGMSILAPGFVNFKSTTISDNTATSHGGGLYMTGGANLFHCTISNNSGSRGGGVYHNPGGTGGNAYVEMYQGTVAFNRASIAGGGIRALAGSSPFRTYGCIVAKNTAPAGSDDTSSAGPDVYGWINSHNTLYGDLSSGFEGTHTDDYYPFDPLLGILMDNAGPNRVKTHALLKGSPAIDRISNPGTVDPVDQRGFPRPASGLWDLGAYEAGPFETELLTVIGKSSDDHTVQTESGLSNGKGTLLRADAVGDYVTYAVAIPEPGTYDIAVRAKLGPNRAKVELATAPGTDDFTPIGTVDLYRSSLLYTTKTVGSFPFTSAGIKHFRFRVTGRNAASTGYLCFFDRIRIIRQ